MEQKILKAKLNKINPSCVVADHLFGKEHTVHHKMLCGILLMVIGVMISKMIPQLHHHPVTHYLADGVGYFLHGMGGIPFGEYLAATATGVAIGAVEENKESNNNQ